MDRSQANPARSGQAMREYMNRIERETIEQLEKQIAERDAKRIASRSKTPSLLSEPKEDTVLAEARDEEGPLRVKREQFSAGPSRARQQGESLCSAASIHPTPTSASLKRPSTAFSDERRPSLSNLPKISKRSSDASPHPDPKAKAPASQPRGIRELPQWYQDVEPPKSRRDKNFMGNVDALLSSLKTMITKCKNVDIRRPLQANARDPIYAEILEKLHSIAFANVNAPMLKKARMLHNIDGLPQLFDREFSDGVDWPWYLKADAEELFSKWSREDFETDIMRGIDFNVRKGTILKSDERGKGRRSDTINKSRGTTKAKYFGHGDLVNGQWWPLQICALRDGAHGAMQAGICGDTEEGAYSCIMSGDHDYPDEDHGEVVKYCGTDSTNGEITNNTQALKQNVANDQPVRLIRSHKVKSQYAPVQGFRYDGLYNVTSYEELDKDKHRYRFRLVRCPEQGPIRSGNGPESRPTSQELFAYETHQANLGKKNK